MTDGERVSFMVINRLCLEIIVANFCQIVYVITMKDTVCCAVC